MTRGRGTPPCQSLLSVMDQLPAAQGKNDSHTEQKAQVEMYYLEFMCVCVCVCVCVCRLTAGHRAAPGCICLHFLRPHYGFLRLLCQWTAALRPAREPAKERERERGGKGKEGVKN